MAESNNTHQDFDYLVVVDFECTCEENNQQFPNEIIEFPLVIVNVALGKIEEEWRTFVRPTQHPTLSAFCTQLTGIQQHQVDGAPELPEALELVHQFLISFGLLTAEGEPTELKFAFLTDGPWDLRNFLDVECRRKKLAKRTYFNQWVNIRWLFSHFYKTKRCGVQAMLSKVGAKFLGQQHSGIADSRNIAHIAQSMIKHGCNMVINDSLAEPIDGNVEYGVRRRNGK